MMSAAQQRHHRATVAQALLNLHEAGELDEPESWSFERLAQLPNWCLLDELQREALQSVCGAIVLAPQMVQWVNGTAFKAAAACAGHRVIESLLDEVQNLEEPLDSQNPEHNLQHNPEPDASEVNELLTAAGASVLHSSLADWMPKERLSATIKPTEERIDQATAMAILHKAEHLLAQQVTT